MRGFEADEPVELVVRGSVWPFRCSLAARLGGCEGGRQVEFVVLTGVLAALSGKCLRP